MQQPFVPGLAPAAPDFVPTTLPPSNGILCPLNPTSAGNLALGIGLVLGTLASFLPQYYSIFRRKTTEGLNIGTIALGVTATTCIFLNFCYLKWDDKVYCCKQGTLGKCIAGTMDGMQILASCMCMFVWTFMWIFYYKMDDSEDIGRIRAYDEIESRRKLVRWVQLGTGGAMLTLLANVLFAALFNTSINAVKLASWIGFILGLIGTVAVIVQWAPQIWTTFKLGSAGSLSVVMLLIQLPGTVAVIYFQAYVNKAHWSTVLPYIVSVIEFVILISLCFFYMARDRYQMWRAAKMAEAMPEYKFAHLDESISSTRVTVPDAATLDEQEAESMMNLELEDGEGSEMEDEFRFRPSNVAPLSETMAQVQRLLPAFKKKEEAPIAAGIDSPVQLDNDFEDNFGLGPDDD